MENDILKLIKIITVLFYDNLTEDHTLTVHEEVQMAMSSIKYTENISSFGTIESAITALSHTAEWMLTAQDTTFVKANIIQRLKVNLQSDNDYVNIAIEALDTEVTPIEARKIVNGIVNELRYQRDKDKLKSLMSVSNAQINYSGDYVDSEKFINELKESLAKLSKVKNGKLKGYIGSIDFNKIEEIESALLKGNELLDPNNLLRTGFQGMERILGMPGLPRGALVNILGITHHYKSGWLIDLALNIPRFNKPWLWDKTKKPLILRLSFENTIDKDIRELYKKIYEMKHNKLCNVTRKGFNVKKASVDIQEYFHSNGYSFALENYDPNTFDVYGVMNVMDMYIEAGYEIHLVSCDYLTQLYPNMSGDRDDIKIQRINEIIRNYCYPKGITFATGHQVSSLGKEMYVSDPIRFTSKASDAACYKNCRALKELLDIELICAIIKHIDGESYLMTSCGKNRYTNDVPEHKKTYTQKFEKVIGIIPDEDGEKQWIESPPNMYEATDY